MADSSLPVATPPGGAPQSNTATRTRPDGAHVQQIILAEPDTGNVYGITDGAPVFDPASARGQSLYPPRALQYARDTQDQMRVVVASGAAMAVHQYWGNTNTWPTWYSTGSGSSMDVREEQRERSLHTFQVQRNRWTFT
jgi:hypothetical protein